MDIFGLIALANANSKGGKNTFNFKGAKASINQLPIYADNGDMYKVEENNHYYIYGDDGWTDAGYVFNADSMQEYIDNELSKLKMLSFADIEEVSS